MANNVEMVQQIYSAFGKGDVNAIMGFIGDDMKEFRIISKDAGEVPWHMHITRKADVPKFFQALAAECNFTKFEPHDFAATGDHVYCTIDWEATFKRSGKKVAMTVLHHFTFKGGHVVAWEGSEDTANAIASFRS
jgi:ketosteroid isomerase-like protein